MWISGDLIVYDEPTQAERAVKTIPGAKALANGYFAFPNTLYNVQLARWIGLPVPPPLAAYDWPGQFTPFAAQKTMANFMTVHPRCLNLSDMGTGKTLAALWASDFLMQKNPGMKTLIVSPLSTLYRVWQDAIFQHLLGRRKCVVLHGDAKKRKKLLAEPADYYIVNFDGVGVLRKELAERKDIAIVVVDEASAYRDGTTKRHRIARAILGGRAYFWLMTGTPTPNSPLDAYGLAKLINNSFGESFLGFKSRVMEQVSKWVWMPRPGAHEMAHRLMQPSIRFAIEDCMDLPAQLVQQRDVAFSPKQTAAYERLKADLVLRLKEKDTIITAVNQAVLRLKLIQIAAGAVYDSEHEVHLMDAAPRIAILREVMQECREKIIIFAPLTSVVNMLFAELSRDNSCAVITGAVSSKVRADIFRDFQEAENPRVLIADPATMSHGLTLVRATCIIWYAPTDRTELYLQANKRIDRPGQTKTNVVIQLAATRIEREIYRRLATNESMQGLILELAKGEGDAGAAEYSTETNGSGDDQKVSGTEDNEGVENETARAGDSALHGEHDADREPVDGRDQQA
jgi:SNF2 family DNA or RNA helicase